MDVTDGYHSVFLHDKCRNDLNVSVSWDEVSSNFTLTLTNEATAVRKPRYSWGGVVVTGLGS